MQFFIKKAGITVELNADALKPEYITAATQRGFKEALQDSVAPAKSKEEAEGLLLKCVDKFVSGTYNSHERASSVDPIAKEAARLARAKGVKKEDVSAWIELHPAILELAKRNLAELAGLPTG